MARKLFCEISPLAYKISLKKEIAVRHIKNLFFKGTFAKKISEDLLCKTVYKSRSLIRRKLGNVDSALQENKAVNLKIAAAELNGVTIYPGETFSFWSLVGSCTEQKGYKNGLVIVKGKPSEGIGGGLCQLTNMIHWLVLHSPLDIDEYHHHDGIDLFPDYGRQIPFGTGTSIMYNYLDYRFKNNTGQPFQLVIYTDDVYLNGELRTTGPIDISYHIYVEDERFVRIDDAVYRTGNVIRKKIDKRTGNTLSSDIIKVNMAKVMYDTSDLDITV